MKAMIHKILSLAVVLGCFVTFEAKGQTPEDLMIKANALYNESAYDSAATIYNDIISQGYSSATLYYNLGNTYYKLKNYPLSIYYYEKSLKLEPNNDDTKHNLEIANMFITDKIEPMPEFFLKTWWAKFGNLFTVGSWSVISLVIFGLTLSCIFIYTISRSRFMKKCSFFVGILMIVFTICSFSITWKKYNYIKSHDEGIIVTPTVTVKSSPSSSSVDLFVLHEGSKVKIMDHTDNWDKIKIANGSVGWLPSPSIIKY